MKNLILISIFCAYIANAQGFMPPFDFGSTATGEITMDDGNIYKGKFTREPRF